MPFAFERLPGAVTGASGVEHFGNPLREQRWLAEGNGVIERSDRRVIAVDGVDRLTWLDSITSQEVASLTAGSSTELMVLDPQGRVEHVAAVFDDGDTAWLIADEHDAPALAAWLKKMVFRSRVTVTERADLAVIAFVQGAADGEMASAFYAPAGIAVRWSDPWTRVSAGGHQYARVQNHPGEELRWNEAVVPTAVMADVTARMAAGIVTGQGPWPAGLLAAEALRIAAWRPRWANEVDEKSLPHESDWLRSAVHLNKGCYRGQETVAKVHNLGHPPRRLVMLHLDGSDSAMPARGAPVYNGEAVVGSVTSAALHYEDGPIALAVISRRTPDDVALTVDVDGLHIAAAQQVIVPGDAGATASVPRLPRLGRRTPAQ